MENDSCGISPLTRALGVSLIEGLGLQGTVHGSLFLRKEYRSYIMAEVNPEVMSRDEYLVASLFSKFPFDIGINRKRVALEKFSMVEEKLISSDANLRHHLRRPNDFWDFGFHWIFHSMKVKIGKCLGPFSWDRCEPYFGFGPGASYDVKRRVSQAPNKYGKEKPSTTMGNLDLAVAAIRSHSVWRDFHTSVSGQDPSQWFTIVPGNKVVTVPKNSKTDRIIAIEPTMNMYIQKGLGGCIRNCLRRIGVDLNDQTRNQDLARKGSLSGSLCTLDLSSASDSVSLFLIEEFLPDPWVSAIKLCRSPRGVLPDGSVITYRKVSSMGNGFTFELESLIFWALCSSVIEYLGLSDRTCSIYGDDLIVPTGAAFLVTKMLALVGFDQPE